MTRAIETKAWLPVTSAIAIAALAGLTATTVSAGDDSGAAKAKPTPTKPAPASPAAVAAGKQAFEDVARVLLSPRCRNCHPAGDAPLQTDKGRPHRMNITRLSEKNGLPCSTCHQEKNSEVLGIAGGPPGAPHWQLPPKETPMIFEGRTPAALCEQLKDPQQNGGRSLADLQHHVEKDALVLWAWKPGGKRTLPPLTHEQFVDAFRTWVASNGACP